MKHFTGCFPSLDEQERGVIGQEISDSEVRRAVFEMNPWKAPGVDGFHAGFYHQFWNDIGPQICQFVRGVFERRVVEASVNKTLLVLISKKENTLRFCEFRPISLCMLLYKIITKIIANRLKEVMCKLVLPNQSSFVPGRHITDNVLIAQEVMHSMKMKKGKVKWMTMKIDLEKTYDRLSWEFIEDTLKDVGLPSNLIRLIIN